MFPPPPAVLLFLIADGPHHIHHIPDPATYKKWLLLHLRNPRPYCNPHISFPGTIQVLRLQNSIPDNFLFWQFLHTLEMTL